MSDRTPEHWEACGPGSFEGRDGFVETPAYIKVVSRSESGEKLTRIIADVHNGDSDEGSANAAFIVKACNNHDEMLKALGNLLRWADGVIGEPDKAMGTQTFGNKCIRDAVAAIKEAEAPNA